jgi:predicted GIY-YIG superfamily endonuclease
MNSKTNIYVLYLTGRRWYIGKSNDIIKRYQEHINGYGSAWTKKYKPISIEKIIENVSPFEEDKITKEYMSKYGINKVRGGSYVEIELSDFHIDALNMEIWSAKNLCTQCGRSGHFVKDCFAKIDIFGNEIKLEEPSETEFSHGLHEASHRDICYRCGRFGHYSPYCYATKHIKGYYI